MMGFGFVARPFEKASIQCSEAFGICIPLAVLPASAQQSSLEKGSKVKPLGSPMSLFTRIFLFPPSKEDISILGASRFQSVQYKLLWIN